MLEGNPWYRNTSRKNSSAVSLLLAVLYVGINIVIFVRRSIMIKIISCPDVDSGNGPKKSIAVDSQARLGIDIKKSYNSYSKSSSRNSIPVCLLGLFILNLE